MAQCKLIELSNGEIPIKTYKDLTSRMVCETPTDKCNFSQCKECPGYTELKVLFEDAFEQNSIEHVT